MYSITFVVDSQKISTMWNEKFPNVSLPSNIVSEAEALKSTVEGLWRTCEAHHLSKLSNITKLELRGNYEVYVLPPLFEEGYYIDSHTIAWGYTDMYPGYVCIGLTHELLHCITHIFYTQLTDDQKWLFHTIVYLAVDEEFYRELANTESYFTSPLLNWYHPRLIETAQKLLPIWKEYMTDNSHGTLYDLYADITN